MKSKTLVTAAAAVGIDLPRLRSAVTETGPYLQRRSSFRKAAQGRHEFAMGPPHPCFGDKTASAGDARGHYFHQDLYVAQQIFHARPRKHVDVGGRIDGFVAHVASYRPIEVYDVRAMDIQIPNVEFHQRDIMRADPDLDAFTDSLSCLHTLEHFGLGRYGDALSYDGHLTGFANLARMVQPGGTLYFSVPIGEHQRVVFDAHRIFSIQYLMNCVIGSQFRITRFAYVDDDGNLHRNVDLASHEASSTFGLSQGCGIFTLTKTE